MILANLAEISAYSSASASVIINQDWYSSGKGKVCLGNGLILRVYSYMTLPKLINDGFGTEWVEVPAQV
jgi:hypothetical protein